MKTIKVYDTTLRDGCQAEHVALSVEDKLRIARRLDDLGVAYVEGGWPNESNPRDQQFFQRAQDMEWTTAKIAAFGSTRRGGIAAEDDSNLQQLRIFRGFAGEGRRVQPLAGVFSLPRVLAWRRFEAFEKKRVITNAPQPLFTPKLQAFA